MNTQPLRLVVGDVEAEVLQEALELYLQARPPGADSRFDYRYRAAQAVLDTLWQGSRDVAEDSAGDDERPATTGLWTRRNTERLED
jgi:hypothetical protein